MGRPNLVDQAYEVFLRAQRKAGADYPDEVSFIGGFMACFGILTGKLDIGLDENAPLTEHYEAVHRSLDDLRSRVMRNGGMVKR